MMGGHSARDAISAAHREGEEFGGRAAAAIMARSERAHGQQRGAGRVQLAVVPQNELAARMQPTLADHGKSSSHSPRSQELKFDSVTDCMAGPGLAFEWNN